MWELVKRSVQRERAMTAAQLGRPRRASVQRMHNEIVEAFLKAGRQRVRRTSSGRLGSVDSVVGEAVRGRGVRGGIWRAVSSLGFAIAMAIRMLNPYVLISVAFGEHRSLLAHLSARVDSMRAVLSPRIGRRRRLTAWVQDILPQRHVPEAASAVWQDGSLLCGIVEAAVPGSCPGYDSLSPPNADRGATLWLGQKLAARYLGVPPVFSSDEFSQPYLTVYMDRRMLRYLAALKAASARVEAERERRFAVLQNSGGTAVEDDAFCLDTIAHSSLPPGESLLECVARGMGLVLGVQGRKSTFFLYLNPHHPHRHVHRLMQRANTLERHPSFEEEAGAILMQIRGPEGDFGAALLSTSPGSSSSTFGPSLTILNENWYGRIPISYETTEESVLVSFVPQNSGRHELILLQRGGSHVPGSPFSITVEDSSEVPDDNGRLKRFGSEPVDGLVVPTFKGITKTTSYESGLEKDHRRFGSEGSDPGTKSEGNTPEGTRKKRRVVARVVDFVTEKMILTEDGKLERLPKRRRRDLEKFSNKERVLVNADDEVIEIMQNRHFTTLYPSWGRMRQFEVDDPIHGTYPGRRSPVESDESGATYGFSSSGLKMGTNTDKLDGIDKRGKGKSQRGDRSIRVSDIASHNEKESLETINFREHCRRILWLCDILLKHSPRQESLEMLNTAGDILEGKRVHPTIMEESEPEDTAAAAPSSTAHVKTSDLPKVPEGRARAAPSTSHPFAQRLQRAPSDTGGLNEVSAWKEGRRQFHSWSRQDREGGGTVGGRLVHKGGSYRGVVVRDMTPEALTGAYAGGDDRIDDERSLQKEEFEFWEVEEERYLSEARRPDPRRPHHSLPKKRPPSLAKQSENRGGSLETLEQRASTSDREKDGGRATVSGKAPAQIQPPPSAASSPDTESEGAADTKLLGFLSTPAAQIRRHSAVDVATLRSFTDSMPGGPRMKRRGSGDLGTPARPKEDESRKRFTRARQFFETLEKGKDSPPSPPQSGAEEGGDLEAAARVPPGSSIKKKKKKSKEEETTGRSSVGRRTGGVKHRTPVVRGSEDSSESTTESDKGKRHRRKARRGTSEKTHSAPGSDVESSGSVSLDHPSLHKRRREKELVLRSQRFGGSEREVKVSERFNVMDLFRDVAGPGTGVTSGRATPLGIPHQAAVLAALRSVEDVRRCETASPYDMYRPVEADNDCEPTVAAAGEEEEGEPAASAAAGGNDENANVDEEGNVTLSSPMTLCVKKEYQSEYPHLPMTSPRHSRHRSSNTDLIPRNVLLQLDTNQNAPKKSPSSRRSIAELF